MRKRQHPEQGCLVIKLAKVFAHERLGAACAPVFEINARSCSSWYFIRKNGLDRSARIRIPDEPTITHPNSRGAGSRATLMLAPKHNR